ncbi:SpoIIE family protein phosphatase [Streptomyces sp. J2-1]|uniref:SpoIIE family protein phosphatase n=1 Tax=Streptomyces corallincola TaxID=2851888 RepID=UPI001C37F9CB|nr:SpoIIE family protein phosphatase [Streptomyces corallincola]MBV2352981.1 SpoIIE family protein phosphatase [Streptomyces corallincola]
MSYPTPADRPSAHPSGHGPVEALIHQTRRLRGDVYAVRRDTRGGGGTTPEERWQRALYDLALHQLEDLDAHLAQLRDGPEAGGAREHPDADAGALPAGTAAPPTGSLLSRVGSAEWNLLTSEVSWSAELYQILGRDPARPAPTLDELPSLIALEDRPKLTTMLTDCLVDGRPIDGEFRALRLDGSVRTVHLMGEPVLGPDGSALSMWAVVRDVSELRRHRRTVRETRDSAQRQFRETTPPNAVGYAVPRTLDLATRQLPSTAGVSSGWQWCDGLELPDGTALLSTGDFPDVQRTTTGYGADMLLGAVRGLALAGTGPGLLLGLLDHLPDSGARTASHSTVCCRYHHATRTLTWACGGGPAPLLFRGGTGRVLAAPEGARGGGLPGTAYAQTETTLEPGDVLLLHTGSPAAGRRTDTVARLLALAPRLSAARSAQECARATAAEFGAAARERDARILVARVTG